MGCFCPEPVECDVCGSFDDVEEEQGVHLCDSCLTRRPYA